MNTSKCRYSLQVLSPGLPDCPPSVMVKFDREWFLFNCGEGTQRLCSEHKIRLANRCKTVFVTRPKWECVGGLPGMMLTLADAGTEGLTVYGPAGVSDYFSATKSFLQRKTFSLDVGEWTVNGASDSKSPTLQVLEASEKFVSPMLTVTPVIVKNVRAICKRKRVSSTADETRGIFNQRQAKTIIDHTFDTQASRELVTDTNLSPHRPDCKWQKPSGPDSSRFALGRQSATQTDVECEWERRGGDPAADFRCTADNHGVCDRKTLFGDGHQVWRQNFKSECDPRFAASGRLQRSDEVASYAVDVASMVYICQGPPMRGEFLVENAKKLGLRAGPDFAKLARGESVINDAGHIVTPKQVMSPGRDGAIWIIVDIPSDAVASALLDAHSVWRPYAPKGEAHSNLRLVVYLLGRGVAQSSQFLAFSATFGDQVPAHIVCGEELGPEYTVFHAHAILQKKLQALSREMFHPPYQSLHAKFALPARFTVPLPLQEFLIEPKNGQNKVGASLFNPLSECSDIRGFDSLERLSTDSSTVVVPLGTGSAIPSKCRNVSSTLLLFFSPSTRELVTAILFDCGEGTFGQLYRAAGPSGTLAVLEKLALVFVSHMHADHHIGIIRLLKARADVTDKALSIIAPQPFLDFLHDYQKFEPLRGFERLELLDSELFVAGPTRLDLAEGVRDVHTVPVVHCHSAYAAVVTLGSGWKVAFSGDCRPSEKFEQAGKGADLLIHEATFDDSLKQEAIDKKHCTVSEAINVGCNMGARVTMLTHFSQRYPKFSDALFESVESSSKSTLVVAFDLIRCYFPSNINWSEHYKGLERILAETD